MGRKRPKSDIGTSGLRLLKIVLLAGSVLTAGINLLITVPMNFLLNKYWAYEQKGQNM